MLLPSDGFWLMPWLWTDVVLLSLAALAPRTDAFALPLSQLTLEGK